MLDSSGTWVGIDVSKRFLDVCIDTSGIPFQITNDLAGFGQLLDRLADQKIAGIVVEHTGQYSEAVWCALDDAQYPPSLVHPNHIVHYRKGGHGRAKTDRHDARVLATFGQERRPAVTSRRSQTEQLLRDLVHMRRGLVSACVAAQQRLRARWSETMAAVHTTYLTITRQQIRLLEQEIQTVIASDPATRDRDALLRSVKGIGPIRSATIIADLPELGTLDRKKIAMLVGLAPIANDSGTLRKPRYIAGGRGHVRGELVMLVRTVRCEPAIRAHRAALLAQHKRPIVADCATARWFLTALNAMVRMGLRWDELDCARAVEEMPQPA